MKKIIAIILTAVCLTGCRPYAEAIGGDNGGTLFVVVENRPNYSIVYDAETKVMYAVSNGYYNAGTVSVLYEADGTPKLWKGETE